MVFILAEAEVEWQSKWIFRPRQRIGDTVEDYYIQFCDWKEEMISLSFPAEEDDYINGFIENLWWNIRSRVVSKWRLGINSLGDAFYNAKWEESMINIEGNFNKIKANMRFDELPSQTPLTECKEDIFPAIKSIELVEEQENYHCELQFPTLIEDDGAQVPCHMFDEFIHGKAYNILVVGVHESEDKAYKVFAEMSKSSLEGDLLALEGMKCPSQVPIETENNSVLEAKQKGDVQLFKEQQVEASISAATLEDKSTDSPYTISLKESTVGEENRTWSVVNNMLDRLAELYPALTVNRQSVLGSICSTKARAGDVASSLEMFLDKSVVGEDAYNVFDKMLNPAPTTGLLTAYDSFYISLLGNEVITALYEVGILLADVPKKSHSSKHGIVELLVGKVLMFVFDPGASSLFYKGCDPFLVKLMDKVEEVFPSKTDEMKVGYQLFDKLPCPILIKYNGKSECHGDLVLSSIGLLIIMGYEEAAPKDTFGGTKAGTVLAFDHVVPISRVQADEHLKIGSTLNKGVEIVLKKWSREVSTLRAFNPPHVYDKLMVYNYSIVEDGFHLFDPGGSALLVIEKREEKYNSQSRELNSLKCCLLQKLVEIVEPLHKAHGEQIDQIIGTKKVAMLEEIIFRMELGQFLTRYILEGKDVLKGKGVVIRLVLKQDERLTGVSANYYAHMRYFLFSFDYNCMMINNGISLIHLGSMGIDLEDESYIDDALNKLGLQLSCFSSNGQIFKDDHVLHMNQFGEDLAGVFFVLGLKQYRGFLMISNLQIIPKGPAWLNAFPHKQGHLSNSSIVQFAMNCDNYFFNIDVENFIWDPGLVWDFQLVPIRVVEVSFPTFVWDPGLVGVFHFTTLRTRRLLRGRICHDPSFYYDPSI